MGIKGLMKFLQDAAPKAVHDIHSMQAYTGRLVAIDASMCLYQFLIMIREGHSGTYSNLTNEEGRVTSHLVGMLTRTIRLMEAGIKPVYVFDGKPPDLKLQELDVRRQKRDEASANLQAAMEAGDSEQVLKSTKASVKVTKEQNEDTKKLLRLMGIPVVEAPSEAEATCAALCRDGKVYASATEDADCLTFGTKILIRNLMAAESQKKQIMEVRLDRALEQLNISMDQFIDFCILCGCDYCNSLKGIGPATAIRLLLQHGTLENVVAALAEEKVPKNFRFQAAREFFKECEAVNASEISFKFEEPDFAGLTHFLVEENSFSKDRVDRYVERLKHAVSRTKQKTLDTFFGTPKVVIKESDKFSPSKRKSAPKAMAGTALATTAAAPAPAPALAAAPAAPAVARGSGKRPPGLVPGAKRARD